MRYPREHAEKEGGEKKKKSSTRAAAKHVPAVRAKAARLGLETKRRGGREKGREKELFTFFGTSFLVSSLGTAKIVHRGPRWRAWGAKEKKRKGGRKKKRKGKEEAGRERIVPIGIPSHLLAPLVNSSLPVSHRHQGARERKGQEEKKKGKKKERLAFSFFPRTHRRRGRVLQH